jgi:hypothetical protein
MNATDGNDSNQAEPPHQTKRAHSQLTNDSEVEEIDPEIGTESPLNRTTKRACLHTEIAASSSAQLADESTGDNYSPPCSVELIKEVATTSSGEGTSAHGYFEPDIQNQSSSESDDDEDLFNIDEDRSLLVNEDTTTAALRTTNEATGGGNQIRQSDEANVITDDEDDQNRRNHRQNSVISEQNSQAGSNAELNFTRSRYRDNVHRGYLSHNIRSHDPVSHNNQYQHYHHGLPANNSHNYRYNQFQRHANHGHNNQRFRACNAHANRASDARLDQSFANFTNSRLAGSQQQQANNNGYEFCANEFSPSNQQGSLAAVSNQRSTNAPHEQTNDEANSFADSFFSFINEPRQESPRYNNMNTAASSSLANDMNCLSSSYVPPNAQLSYLPRRTSTAHLIQNSRFNRNNGGASSNHHHQFDQLEDQVQHQGSRYIPSSMGTRNSTNQTQTNTCGSGNGNNNNNSSRNYHYHNPANMHANFTRLWHEQNNQMEMHRNANLHRRYVRLFLFDYYSYKLSLKIMGEMSESFWILF